VVPLISSPLELVVQVVAVTTKAKLVELETRLQLLHHKVTLVEIMMLVELTLAVAAVVALVQQEEQEIIMLLVLAVQELLIQ
jgi:hypothetical protein